MYSCRKITINDLRFHLQKYVNVKNETIEKICKHPKLFLASFDQILDTLNYLKKKFTEEEILESIPIVLYSR